MKWIWGNTPEFEKSTAIGDDAYSHHYHAVRQVENLVANQDFEGHQNLESLGESKYRTKIEHKNKLTTIYVTTKVNETERFEVYLGTNNKSGNRKFLLQDVTLDKEEGQRVRCDSIRWVLELLNILKTKKVKVKKPRLKDVERIVDYNEFNHTKVPDAVETIDYGEFNKINEQKEISTKPRTYFDKLFGRKITA